MVHLLAVPISPCGPLDRVLADPLPIDELAASVLAHTPTNSSSGHTAKIAIDDFGTGYSMLSHLKSLPVDTLKIDRSFVRELGSNEGDLAIVRAIIALAAAFGLQLVAEGVETEAAAMTLLQHGCYRARLSAIAACHGSGDGIAVRQGIFAGAVLGSGRGSRIGEHIWTRITSGRWSPRASVRRSVT